MDLLLHFKVNEGDENNINIQEYMLYGDVETKSEKCLVDEGDEVVLTEFPVPEFKNCTLMKKGDEGFYEYKDYRQGENAELAKQMDNKVGIDESIESFVKLPEPERTRESRNSRDWDIEL